MKIKFNLTIDVTEQDTGAMLAAAHTLLGSLIFPQRPDVSVSPTGPTALQPAAQPPAPVEAKQLVTQPTPVSQHRKKLGRPPKASSPTAANELPFEEFDQLVRKEMRRLAVAGVMPGPKLWNELRDARLPHLAGVMDRYGLANLTALGALLGLAAPLMHNGESK